MAKNLGWRGLIAAFLVFMALVYLVPSLLEKLPASWPRLLPREKINLGLDLQGGMHLVLEVEAAKAVESHLERAIEEIKQDLRKEKIRYLELQRSGIEGIRLTLMRGADEEKFKDKVMANYADFDLEVRGQADEGLPLTLVLQDSARTHIMKMAADQALETIRNRVDQFGVSEPDIRPQENHRILIQLPGIKDPQRAIELIGKTALLEFKLVDEESSLEEALKGNLPPGTEILYQTTEGPQADRKGRIPFLLKRRTLLTGEYLTDARVQIDSRDNRPYISMSFNARGGRL